MRVEDIATHANAQFLDDVMVMSTNEKSDSGVSKGIGIIDQTPIGQNTQTTKDTTFRNMAIGDPVSRDSNELNRSNMGTSAMDNDILLDSLIKSHKRSQRNRQVYNFSQMHAMRRNCPRFSRLSRTNEQRNQPNF